MAGSKGLLVVDIEPLLDIRETLAVAGSAVAEPLTKGPRGARAPLPTQLVTWVAQQRAFYQKHRRKVAGLTHGKSADLEMQYGMDHVMIRSKSGLFRDRRYATRYFEAALVALGKRYPRREEILRWYYGLGPGLWGVSELMTLKGLGELFGVSITRVRTERDRAVQLLFTMLAVVDELAEREERVLQTEVAEEFERTPHGGGLDAWRGLKAARDEVAERRRVQAAKLMARLQGGTVTKALPSGNLP